MDLQKAISVLETTRLMFEMSLPLTDNDCDRDTIDAREDNEETIEAINEAIKALKREPCDDVISRKEALKELDTNPLFNSADDKATAPITVASLDPVTCSDKLLTSTDAVSREAVLELIKRFDTDQGRQIITFDECDPCSLDNFGCVIDKLIEGMTDDIKVLPPVTPERPKGEWKSDGHGHIYCTNCNQTNVSMWKSAFCPSCGADMRGVSGCSEEKQV